MYYPTLEEARQIAGTGDFRSIPITREILSDFTTPIQAMRILRTESSHCFLLESAADRAQWGRYTFLGFDPTLEVTCTDGLLTLRGGGAPAPAHRPSRPGPAGAARRPQKPAPARPAALDRRTGGLLLV